MDARDPPRYWRTGRSTPSSSSTSAARTAELLGRAAQHVSGERNPAVEHHARALSAVSAAHGNNRLLHRHASQ